MDVEPPEGVFNACVAQELRIVLPPPREAAQAPAQAPKRYEYM